MVSKSLNKWQFGDFQTPAALANKVVQVLKRNHKIDPDVIIEPTCGKGAFVLASCNEFKNPRVLGFDINPDYVKETNSALKCSSATGRASVREANFFDTDWGEILSGLNGYILIIGNPPWVTSSDLGFLDSKNLPQKSNFQRRKGIAAITGSGNFDISEWMLLQHVTWLSKREGAIAILCKFTVARKVIRQIQQLTIRHFSSFIYPVDAQTYFSASVEACLFVLLTSQKSADCEIYNSMDALTPCRAIGNRDGIIVSSIEKYEKWKHLKGQDFRYIWRSGIKHDCAKIMELEPVNGGYKNGLDELVKCEDDYLYPLLKGSDIGNGRISSYRKVVIVTQKTVGEDTSQIKNTSLKTWEYLTGHREYLDRRRSSIYKNKPEFSVFGVGPYTFKPWKIVISGLHKRLKFNFVGLLDGKTVVFDDTVNFLSFDSEEEARFIYQLITSVPATEFLESMIFWDEKRPITVEVLRRLSLKEVARELGEIEQYLGWTEFQPSNHIGQVELAIAERKPGYMQQFPLTPGSS